MKMKTTLKKILAMMLAVLMLFAIVGCAEGDASSTLDQTQNVFEEPVDTEDEDVIVEGETDADTESKNSEKGDKVDASSGKSDKNSDKNSKGSNTSSKNGTTSSGNKNNILNSGSANNSNAANTSSVVSAENTFERDEEATKDFFSTIPRKLRGQTVKVMTWWDPSPIEQAKSKVFEEKTGIKIKWINCGLGNQFTKLAAMIGQNNPPDIAPIIQSDFPAIIMQDYFQPLSNAKLDLKDKMYDIETMDKFKYNDTYYGAMIKSSTMVTFYVTLFNKDMFTRHGIPTPYDLWQKGDWNWETFVDTCEKLKDKGVQYGVVGDYGGNWFTATTGEDAVMFKNGKMINNTKSENLIKGYQFVNDLRDKYKALEGGTNYTYFKSEDAGMTLTGNYIMQNNDWLDKNIKFNWGYAPAPCPKGQKVVVPSTVKMFGFPKGAKNTEAAGWWLRYWLDSTFDPADTPLWSQKTEGVLEFNSWLWEQEKSYFYHRGIVTYGADFDEYAMSTELCGCGSENVKTVLEKWSGVIDSKIKRLETER